MTTPDISIVVTIVDGGPALVRCLEALGRQADAPDMDVIVPYDDTVAEVAGLAVRFPEVRFLDVGNIAQAGSSRNAYWEHVRYDCRRSLGLLAARGRLIAMLEDRGWPRPDWARRMVDLHDATPHGVIGGAIESGARNGFGWAVFFCDFGRSEPPLEMDDPEYVCDINICYKRDALESVRSLWQARYQEASVNWALRRKGWKLCLSEAPVVVQQRDLPSVRSMLMERLHWGRTYGQLRVREGARWKGLVWALALPILPFLLFLRHYRQRKSKGRHIGEFWNAAPALFLLLVFWSLGECLGYCEEALAPRAKAPAQASSCGPVR